MKEKHAIETYDNIRIDTRIILDKKAVKHFAINVAIIREDGKTEDVFRVDTAHEGLHEMKFWISSEPKYLEKTKKEDYTHDLNQWVQIVDENFRTWVKTYKERKGLL